MLTLCDDDTSECDGVIRAICFPADQANKELYACGMQDKKK